MSETPYTPPPVDPKDPEVIRFPAETLDAIKTQMSEKLKGYIGQYNTPEVQAQITKQLNDALTGFLPPSAGVKDLQMKSMWSMMSNWEKILWVVINRFTGIGAKLRAWAANPPHWLAPDPRGHMDITFTLTGVPVPPEPELEPKPETPAS